MWSGLIMCINVSSWSCDYLITTDMILKESASEGPDTGEDKVDLIQFSGGVWWSVVLCQQAVQQGAESLIDQNIEMLQCTWRDNTKEPLTWNYWENQPVPCCFLEWGWWFSGYSGLAPSSKAHTYQTKWWGWLALIGPVGYLSNLPHTCEMRCVNQKPKDWRTTNKYFIVWV